MAGDWIKIEHSLPHKPEVMQLASILGIDDMAVVGHLVLFWSWVDQNLSPSCPVVRGTTSGLDRVVGRDGFSTAMMKVGWLNMQDGVIGIPNYDHHLSESAKKRGLDTRKKKRQRNLSRDCPADVPAIVPVSVPVQAGQNGGLEKRREEKRRVIRSKNPLTPFGFEKFWQAYPRKKAKESAIKAYAEALERLAAEKSISVEAAAEWLLAATIERAEELASRESQYQPYPASWLRSGGYNDEKDKPQETKPKGKYDWIFTPTAEIETK